MKTKEQKIMEWTEHKMRVKFVMLINETFRGLPVSKDDTVTWVVEAIDRLLGEVTQIGDLAGTGLGMQRRGFEDE